MIKFSKKEVATVHVTADVDHEGDVIIRANGTVLLYIFNDGTIGRSATNATALKSMGFKLDETDRVEIDD